MPATQEQLKDAKTLAVGLIHIQMGNADLEFPTSSRAHPSWWVWIVLTPKGPLWDSAGAVFPLKVRWNIWQEVIVPLLSDPDNQFFTDNGATKNWGLLSLLHDYEKLIGYFSYKLVDALKAGGYLPPDLVVEVVEAPTVPQSISNPEAVQAQAELEAAGGTVYQKFDAVIEGPVYQKFDE